jgi:hypothetical protein
MIQRTRCAEPASPTNNIRFIGGQFKCEVPMILWLHTMLSSLLKKYSEMLCDLHLWTV